MLHSLLEADYQLFYWINTGLSNPVFDALLPWCRERWLWTPLYLYIIIRAWLQFSPAIFWIFLLGLVLSVGMTDTMSSKLIKKNVERLRPCNDATLPVPVILRIEHCGSGYSFTSSHAANHFAVAVFLIGFLRKNRQKIRLLLLIWASVIAFSQVYVGVHFPADVVTGAVLGAIIGWRVSVFCRKYMPLDASA